MYPRGEGSASRGVCLEGSASRWEGLHLGGLHPRGLPGGTASRWRGLHQGGSSWGVCIQKGGSTSGQSAGDLLSSPSLPMGGWADLLPSVNRMTHRCENITLDQTSFAGVKYHLSAPGLSVT